MPSSLERFNSRALEYSSRIPVSVCGTGGPHSGLPTFLGSFFTNARLAVALRCLVKRVCWIHRSVIGRIVVDRCRNINLLCIDYSLRPHLSSRLTLGGRTLPRKPYPYGEMEFNHLYRYLCLHSHFQALHGWLPLPLRCTWNAFLLRLAPPIASVYGLSPDHFRRKFARWVSCYALFK